MAAATPQEILMWALLNRARLNPSGEGVAINEGPVRDFNGNIAVQTADSKQPLAWSDNLGAVADAHTAEMLAQQRMFHRDNDSQKALYNANGYTPSWYGENIANQDIFGTITQNTAIALQHSGLFIDSGTDGRGHRYNILNDQYQEVGVSQLIGNLNGRQQSIISQDFGRPVANTQFLTGIAYNDTDNDAFYSIGEGRGGVTVATTAGNTATATAGNYSKAINAGVQTITYSGGGLPAAVSAEITVLAGRNALVNLVGTSALETSVSLKALGGVTKIIGLGNLGLTLVGNALDNIIVSALGNDSINGAEGIDTVVYSGLRSAYTVTDNGNGTWTVRGAEGTDTLTGVEKVQFKDGIFTLGAPANRAPVVAVADHALKSGETAKIAPWVAYSDADGNAATQYQIIDNGTAAGSGFLIAPNGSQVAAGTTLTVTAADLANVSIRGGSAAGTETMQIRAFDGKDWSAWDSFNLTTTALPVNKAPVATINDRSLKAGEIAKIAGWISYSDAEGNAATQYQFIDNGTAKTSGFLLDAAGKAVAAGTALTVSAADLAKIGISGGTAAGTETMQVRAFDGKDWSAWDSFNFTTTPLPVNRAPVATIDDKSLKVNQWAKVADWIKYSDADGNAAVQYQFVDKSAKATSGYFWTPDNEHHAAKEIFTVKAADLGNVWVRGAQAGGSDNMQVRVFDGIAWSAWDNFKVTTLPNKAPVATIDNKTVKANQWLKVSDILKYTDANGDAAVQYQFVDKYAAAGSGYFYTPDNIHHAANQVFTVNAADLKDVWVRGAQGAGWENMQVRAFDGMTWGAWDTFKLTTVANAAPVATIDDKTVSKNEWVQVSTILKATDANGDAITQYQFVDKYDAAGSGYFYTPDNIHHAANEVFTVNAANLKDVWVRGGAGAGWENMQVRAFDGETWGAWDNFKFTTLNNSAPIVSGASDFNFGANQKVAASSLYRVIDGDAGDQITQFQFFDDTVGGGSFNLNGKVQAADTTITVNASDIAKLTYVSGSTASTDLLWVRANDGDAWSDWHQFNAHTII